MARSNDNRAPYERRHSLDPHDRETIISFNDAKGIALIHTHNEEWQRYLEKELTLRPIEEDEDGGRTYEVAKKRIKPPKAPKKLSPEEKQCIAAYLQAIQFTSVKADDIRRSGGKGGGK